MVFLVLSFLFLSAPIGAETYPDGEKLLRSSQSQPVDTRSWEEREFERIMRLRAIHAGSRNLCPPQPLRVLYIFRRR